MELGVDYYPEHWDRKDWETHARLMQEAGLKVVRLAEFAWAKMEPSAGKFEFGWLDDAIEVLHKHNIKVILGTPTAAPPPWMMAEHPDILAEYMQDGTCAEPGGRRHYCITNQTFRDYSRKIVIAMCQHYCDHPSVVGWQTDNEIGGPRCYCDNCAAAFRDWLKSRYGTLEKLNEAWGTIFWAQIWSDWNQIPVPREKVASHSPSIRLDYLRFHSSQVVSYHDLQVKAIRALCPRHFVTHNCMGFYNEVDYAALCRNLDFVSWDNYPGDYANDRWHGKVIGAHADYMRSIKHQPFTVMEQRSGLPGWLDMYASADNPGQLRLWTWQTVAHGADRVVYFRWRTSRFGIEQYWHGILDHHGIPGRRYREVKRVSQEFTALGDRAVGAKYTAHVGIIHHPESRWALEIQRGVPTFDFMRHLQGWSSAFAYSHAGVEFFDPADEFNGIKVMVAPTLFLCDEKLAAKLADFAEKGGTVVLTFRSGVKDDANVVVDERLPGVLRKMAGCEVEEYAAMVRGEEFPVSFTAPLPKKPAKAGIWLDQLKLAGAKAVARYEAGPWKGSPAMTVNKVGAGRVIYSGFYGDTVFYRWFCRWLLSDLDILSPYAPSDTIEITERVKGNDRLLFILNHADETQKLAMPARPAWRDALTGQKIPRSLTLKPYEVRILAAVPAA